MCERVAAGIGRRVCTLNSAHALETIDCKPAHISHAVFQHRRFKEGFTISVLFRQTFVYVIIRTLILSLLHFLFPGIDGVVW